MLSRFSRAWLCYPVDHSPLRSFLHGILPARIPEWVAISSSRGSSWPRDETFVPDQVQLPALLGGFFTISATWEALIPYWYNWG